MRTSRLVLFPLVALCISGCEQSLMEATGPQDQLGVSDASAPISAGMASRRAKNRPFWATKGNANTDPATDFLGTTDDQPLVFKTNGAEVMRVNTDGNTGIGTSTPEQLLHLVGGDDPTLRIQSDGDHEPSGRLSLRQSNGSGMDIFYDGTSGIDGLRFVRFSQGTNTGTIMFLKNAGPLVGIATSNPAERLHVNGNALADAHLTPSSRRWKENIAPIEGALDKVQRLRGVSYDWKADGGHDIGLIAEEVGEVIPGVVAYEANAIDAQSVDYGRLVAVLIEAIKEQQQQIEELQAVVTSLGAEK